MKASPRVAGLMVALLLVGSCGGGDGSSSGPSGSPATPAPTSSGPAAVYAAPALESLSVADVQTIIAQAVGEADARGRPATIAVTDRVGNVLGVFVMSGTFDRSLTSRLTATGVPNDKDVDLQGASIASAIASISKALTGAYLSSGGNAFSTRTASEIIQSNFPPAPNTVGLESGPLSGVQFSQLPCSDLNTRFTGGAGPDAFIGPKRAPLGLAADPGGFPLYKNGVLVGGIGVMADGDYAFDNNVTDLQVDDEEAIALAGLQGYAAPESIVANRITVDGVSLRYSDMRTADLHPLKSAFTAIQGTVGMLVAVTGYTSGPIIPGTPYGSEASGYRFATATDFAFPDAFVLSNGNGTNRYPVRGGTDAGSVTQPLTATESRTILEEAYKVMIRSRAQIRQPLDSRAQVTISLVDTNGSVLGIVRAPDAPLFGTDVSLQKARTVAFFSGPHAAADMLADPDAEVSDFVDRARKFFNDTSALTGKWAFGARPIGNLSRPHFPDGEAGRPEGPFGRPIEDFNPFATGLQVALIKSNVLEHVIFTDGKALNDTAQQCTLLPATTTGMSRLANGMQIFSGGVPIFRGGEVVGGIGVSGDGIDQDDMISFLGVHNGGQRLGTLGNAAPAMRSDQIVIPVGAGVRLRYVNCPFAPFLDSSEQDACQGK